MLDFPPIWTKDPNHACYVNGVQSDIMTIRCGIAQGAILGPLLFILYVNDLSQCLDHSKARLYADDTNLTAASNCIADLQNQLNSDISNVASWLQTNKLTLNTLKSEYMLIGSRQRIATLEDDLELSVG